MDLSIIVTSFQRAHLLRWQLHSFLKQQGDFTFEIIVLNDGLEDNTQTICKQFSDKLPIRYIYTGHRNANGMKWRIPGFAINIGLKQAVGDSVIITCAEMFLLEDTILQEYVKILKSNDKAIVSTDGKDDRQGFFLKMINQHGGESLDYALYEMDKKMGMHPLCTDYPFFLVINRQACLNIGGFDEDFLGYCWDDLDFVTRLKNSGCHSVKLPHRVVHLYHPRLRYGMQDVKDKWNYNETIYKANIHKLVRNEGREWGKLDA